MEQKGQQGAQQQVQARGLQRMEILSPEERHEGAVAHLQQ